MSKKTITTIALAVLQAVITVLKEVILRPEFKQLNNFIVWRWSI